jgi:hypothetical protein
VNSSDNYSTKNRKKQHASLHDFLWCKGFYAFNSSLFSSQPLPDEMSEESMSPVVSQEQEQQLRRDKLMTYNELTNRIVLAASSSSSPSQSTNGIVSRVAEEFAKAEHCNGSFLIASLPLLNYNSATNNSRSKQQAQERRYVCTDVTLLADLVSIISDRKLCCAVSGGSSDSDHRLRYMLGSENNGGPIPPVWPVDKLKEQIASRIFPFRNGETKEEKERTKRVVEKRTRLCVDYLLHLNLIGRVDDQGGHEQQQRVIPLFMLASTQLDNTLVCLFFIIHFFFILLLMFPKKNVKRKMSSLKSVQDG